MGKFGTDEFAGDREDQTRLNVAQRQILRCSREEIGKCQIRNRVGERRYRLLHPVTGKIDPFEEVSNLVSTDAKCNFKHLRIRDLLAHGCIKTRAALLDVSKMKTCDIRDRLNMCVSGNLEIGVEDAEVSVGSRNRGNVLEIERLRKSGAEVRIGRAAVANVPTGVHIQMHEVREPLDTRRSRSRASLQRAELVEINWLGAPGLKIGVEKGRMAHFIECVARYVLRAIPIEI